MGNDDIKLGSSKCLPNMQIRLETTEMTEDENMAIISGLKRCLTMHIEHKSTQHALHSPHFQCRLAGHVVCCTATDGGESASKSAHERGGHLAQSSKEERECRDTHLSGTFKHLHT